MGPYGFLVKDGDPKMRYIGTIRTVNVGGINKVIIDTSTVEDADGKKYISIWNYYNRIYKGIAYTNAAANFAKIKSIDWVGFRAQYLVITVGINDFVANLNGNAVHVWNTAYDTSVSMGIIHYVPDGTPQWAPIGMPLMTTIVTGSASARGNANFASLYAPRMGENIFTMGGQVPGGEGNYYLPSVGIGYWQ
jgi:hypothetical protein